MEFYNATQIMSYIDFDYINWLVYLFKPIVYAFLAPVIVGVMLYLSDIALNIFKLKHILFYSGGNLREDWRRLALHWIALFWYTHARVWNGYTVRGLENLPATGSAILTYYHGALPIDIYYLVAKMLLHSERKLALVTDRFVFRYWPGTKLIFGALNLIEGTREQCLKALREGHIVVLSPGGTREALFSDNYYNLIWNNRIGFAKLAIESGCPIIPLFTKNIRESFRTIPFGFLRELYERTRQPLVPIYGGFPVKLTTIIGRQIQSTGFTGAQELAEHVNYTINIMISRNQRIPGSILLALLERLSVFDTIKY